jgi:hypothetical protein
MSGEPINFNARDTVAGESRAAQGRDDPHPSWGGHDIGFLPFPVKRLVVLWPSWLSAILFRKPRSP